ncbi:hypothetical protein RCZ15_01990 [Capnocytophaga catalasegens]|uniref:Lipoprotein n=1 Tax=Capnocytophaga catalasegens TaxID=1004260 RepID=A0AAV5ARV1_9FLAO|nr:hypothetical protein RCZ03_18570 [Capnocytophaga catalasegens]GJM49224.1 hypothetical protein RCZ15_01990 [Capnocytophaga catalasegens]GJM53133.1 hypothetical protein RCZ16_14500 [Capnocytophaga catalasegens]
MLSHTPSLVTIIAVFLYSLCINLNDIKTEDNNTNTKSILCHSSIEDSNTPEPNRKITKSETINKRIILNFLKGTFRI